MNKHIGILIFLGSLLFAAAPQANAHGYEQYRFDSPSRYREDVRHGKQMPHWLRRDRGFSYWYWRSSLNRNYFLAWPQLFEIYRWERRHSQHHSRHNYYGYRYRDHGWYRRYWQNYDDRHRPRRNEWNRRRLDNHY